MKHFLLVFIDFFILISFSEAQPYKSIFSKDTTEWRMYECSKYEGHTFSIFSNSDTIINNHIYHSIYRCDYFYIAKPGMGYEYYSEHLGYIMDDSITGKYYIINPTIGKYGDIEKNIFLVNNIMDLNLMKGDTFTFNRMKMDIVKDSVLEVYNYGMPKYNFKVDSVYYLNGRKILELNYNHHGCNDFYHLNNYKFKFIEGIGSTFAFDIFLNESNFLDYVLLCKLENNQKIYSTPADTKNECYLRWWEANVKEQELKLDINLYPNPAISVFWLDIPEAGSMQLSYEIYNNLGEKITSAPIVSTKTKIELPVSGIYYIFITDGKKRTLRKVVFL